MANTVSYAHCAQQFKIFFLLLCELLHPSTFKFPDFLWP